MTSPSRRQVIVDVSELGAAHHADVVQARHEVKALLDDELGVRSTKRDPKKHEPSRSACSGCGLNVDAFPSRRAFRQHAASCS